MPRREPNLRMKRAVSRWTARIIPPMLLGTMGYATFVVVSRLCVNYLLRKHDDASAAAPILVFFFLLLIAWLASFGRLWYMVTFDPPYLPYGENAPIKQKIPLRRRRASELAGQEYDGQVRADEDSEKQRNDPDSPGLEKFYTKNVFVANMDGKPKWCSQCANWKPDRTHHCSDAGRCIYKMDHYCPWVGGPVGENNFKFFIQFTSYTALICLYLLIIMAVYLRQQIVHEDEKVDNNIIALLVLCAFFGLFCTSMSITSSRLACLNQTQVETLNAQTKIYNLSLHVPRHIIYSPETNPPYTEITYPLPLHEQVSAPPASSQSVSPISHPEAAHLSMDGNNHSSYSPLNPTLQTMSKPEHQELPPSTQPQKQAGDRDARAQRKFAVLMTRSGDNPWDLGSYLRNWQTVMGSNVLDWFLPIKQSPCCQHDDPDSHFPLGPAVEDLKVAVGFISPDQRKSFPRTRPQALETTAEKQSVGKTTPMDKSNACLRWLGERGTGK